jgi:hypothetical protein
MNTDPFLSAGMASLAALVAVLLIAAIARAGVKPLIPAVVVCAVMIFQWFIAAAGALHQWDRRPPPFMIFIAASVTLTVWFAFSRAGTAMARNLTFPALIASQAFRFPLELLMHRAAGKGIMPVQMSYSGWNFDILTGITAILVAILVYQGRAGRTLIVVWNILGSLLLVNIVGIAFASTPLIQAFGPQRLNTWVADPPYVWLPGVLVQAALLGHLLIWRKLTVR